MSLQQGSFPEQSRAAAWVAASRAPSSQPSESESLPRGLPEGPEEPPKSPQRRPPSMARQQSRILGESQEDEAPGALQDQARADIPCKPAAAGVVSPAAAVQLLVLAVTDLGHVWQWSLPMGSVADRAPQPKASPGDPTRPATAPPQPPMASVASASSLASSAPGGPVASPAASAKAATRPQLLGLLHMLPSPVSLSVDLRQQHHCIAMGQQLSAASV